MTSPTISANLKKLKENPRLLVGLSCALAALLVGLMLFSHQGLYQLFRFRQERLQLEQENARLKAENDRLARTIERLHHDPAMIQDLIRRELNFVRKNEIIFQLPPGVGAALQPPPASGKWEPPLPQPSAPQPLKPTPSNGKPWAALPGGPSAEAHQGTGAPAPVIPAKPPGPTEPVSQVISLP